MIMNRDDSPPLALPSDPHLAIAIALAARLAPARAVIQTSRERPWASITFSGVRHSYEVEVSGPGAGAAVGALVREIGDMEIALKRDFVADIVITSRKTDWKVSPPAIRLGIEALTVETDYRATPSALRSAAISPAGMGLPELLRAWRRVKALSSRSSKPEIEASSST
jgi:hypothetical protein